jgi:hypothetical protein
VHDAFEGHHHAIEGGTGTGRRWRICCSDLQQTAGGDFDSYEVAARATIQKDIPFLKHFAPSRKWQ